MTTLLLGFLWKAGPFIAAILAALGWGWKQRRAGAEKERAKQAAAEAKARSIADQVDNDVGTLTPDQVKSELEKWVRD